MWFLGFVQLGVAIFMVLNVVAAIYIWSTGELVRQDKPIMLYLIVLALVVAALAACTGVELWFGGLTLLIGRLCG